MAAVTSQAVQGGSTLAGDTVGTDGCLITSRSSHGTEGRVLMYLKYEGLGLETSGSKNSIRQQVDP